MSKIIDGKRYTVSTSTLLADNDYWDGNNFTKGGRNTYLFRTRGNAYFQVVTTQWQGERDSITALTRDQAMRLYEQLPEHYVEYEDAFGVVVEEASAGRPAIYDEPMKQVLVYMPESMIAWLKSQSGSMSEEVRNAVEKYMRDRDDRA